jgi:hypothetical protein
VGEAAARWATVVQESQVVVTMLRLTGGAEQGKNFGFFLIHFPTNTELQIKPEKIVRSLIKYEKISGGRI